MIFHQRESRLKVQDELALHTPFVHAVFTFGYWLNKKPSGESLGNNLDPITIGIQNESNMSHFPIRRSFLKRNS